MNVDASKSIAFLLDKGGPVTRYRLRKEILHDLSAPEEAALLEEIRQTPLMRTLEGYVKPNGYIGIGMHSWDKFKATPLQDGEAAARLLSNYAIPVDDPIVKGFIAALKDEEMLRQEFAYYGPEVARFENRFRGLRCCGGLMALVYACLAMLGVDDDSVRPFVDVSHEAFRSVLDIGGLSDVTEYRPEIKATRGVPYLPEDAYFPCQYHLETLAHTHSWRTEERVDQFVRAVNRIQRVMKPENSVCVKIDNRYYGLWAYCRPFVPFKPEGEHQTAGRKTITLLAMAGGGGIDVVRQSAEAAAEAMAEDGTLRVPFASAYRKKCFRDSLRWPTPYAEIALETDHRSDTALWCELTFWAVQLLHLAGMLNVA